MCGLYNLIKSVGGHGMLYWISKFIEEVKQLDLVELTEGMISGEVLEICEGLKIKREE